MKPCIPFVIVLVSTLCSAAAPTAQSEANPGFERLAAADSTQPEGWRTFGDGYTFYLDHEEPFAGSRSLRVARAGVGNFAVATGSLPVETWAGRHLRVRGQIRTENVKGGQASLWLRVDDQVGRIVLDSMTGTGATGTRAWTPYHVDVYIDPEATTVLYGAMHTGSGTAWFDELTAEENTDLAPRAGKQVLAYIESAIKLMRKHSIHRRRIDWKSMRTMTREHARGAQTPEQTYPALRLALRKLGDRHSFLKTAQSAEAWKGSGEHKQPRGEVLTEGIAYVTIPGFSSGDEGEKTAFADEIQGILRNLDAAAPCGWVVDLRLDSGGNMWPMLAGLGPLLGEGVAGYFVLPNGKRASWGYEEGKALVGETVSAQVSGTPLELSHAHPPVAVLTGPRTASSGEAIVTSFRGRPLTRSFGEPTNGRSTSNRGFDLADGAMLFITSSTFADRTGKLYGEPIPPDEEIPLADADRPLLEQPVIVAALDWLRRQPGCVSE